MGGEAGGEIGVFEITPRKIALITIAYYFGYRFTAIYVASACLIYAAIGDNTR